MILRSQIRSQLGRFTNSLKFKIVESQASSTKLQKHHFSMAGLAQDIEPPG